MPDARPSPPDAAAPLELRVEARMADVPREAWDALVPDEARPHLTWDFLALLESSGSASPDRGWTPLHLTLRRGDALVAAAPGWVKTHSMGEFFYNDFRWPPVAARFGVAYHPKYVITAPFTPVAGPKLLVRPGEDAPALRRRLARAALALARDRGFSSAAVLFASADDLEALEAEGYLPGVGHQYHWENEGFRDFDGFLARFNAKRRHMVRAERAAPAKDGVAIRTLAGGEITPEAADFAGRCYAHTADTHAFGAAHLTPAFFRDAPRRLGVAVELVLAEAGGRPVAAAFNLRGPRRLYGRHWGALEERRFLHFNVCYYEGVARCIALGLEAFEPGAGGEHKMARGFAPALVRSAHAFADEALHAAFSSALRRDAASYAAAVAEARASGRAFRGGTGTGG